MHKEKEAVQHTTVDYFQICLHILSIHILTDPGMVAIFTMSKIVFYPREKLQDYNRSRMILFSSEVKQQLIPKSVMQCPIFSFSDCERNREGDR